MAKSNIFNIDDLETLGLCIVTRQIKLREKIDSLQEHNFAGINTKLIESYDDELIKLGTLFRKVLDSETDIRNAMRDRGVMYNV